VVQDVLVEDQRIGRVADVLDQERRVRRLEDEQRQRPPPDSAEPGQRAKSLGQQFR
jgi:hypothetical protein